MTQERMDRVVQLAVLILCESEQPDKLDSKLAIELSELVLEEMRHKGGWALEPPPLPQGYIPPDWEALRSAVNEGRPSGYSFDQLIAQLLHNEAFRQCSQCGGVGDCTHDAARSVLQLVALNEAVEKMQVRGEPLAREDLEHAKREVDAAMHPTGRCECAGEGTCQWCRESQCVRCSKPLAWNEKFVLEANVGGETVRKWPVCAECYDTIRERWAQAEQAREIHGKAADADGVRLKW